jgi:hypothetical protein
VSPIGLDIVSTFRKMSTKPDQVQVFVLHCQALSSSIPVNLRAMERPKPSANLSEERK